MTAATTGDERQTARSLPRPTNWQQVVFVFVLFFVWSALCRPVPSVNEPHYLTKARHVWQPTWCEGDFFLNSSSPHLVFYRTIGALTNWLTLTQAAWVGRAIALMLLAWGWTRLLSQVSADRWVAAASAGWFLLLQSLGNFSGEWLVGGVESKVLAYALAFAGWAALLEARPVAAGLGLGLAVSFHPVVGGWCVIAAGMALSTTARFDRQRFDRRWIAGGLLLMACALPGLIPAIQSLGGVDPQAAALADRYQVGTRLAHHLDPLTFPLSAYRYYGLLLVIWLLLLRLRPDVPLGRTIESHARQSRARQEAAPGDAGRLVETHLADERPLTDVRGSDDERGSDGSESASQRRRVFHRIVLAALVIAATGLVIAWGPRPIQTMPLARVRIWLLKFYPFRLADLLVPLAAAVATCELLSTAAKPADDRLWRRGGVVLAALAFLSALCLPHPDKNPSRMAAEKRAEWIAACEWIRVQTPPDVLVQAVHDQWAVRWFAQRAEYVNYKDCPQDPAGILEWARRLRTIRRWQREAPSDGVVSTDELRQLHVETGITHLLVSRLGPIAEEPVYENSSFRVYAIDR